MITVKQGVGDQSTWIIRLSIWGNSKWRAPSVAGQLCSRLILSLQLSLVNTLYISSVILVEVRQSIIQHDWRGEIGWESKADLAHIFGDIQLGINLLDGFPLRLRCTR